MEKQKLLKELEEKFKIMKKQLGFKSTLDDIETIFFVRDFILAQGFVSPALSRQICSRIVDTYLSWNSWLHSLIIPDPQSMICMHESKMFGKEEKEEILKTITKTMALLRTNSLVGLTKNKEQEAKFIDDAVKFWKTSLKPKLIKIVKKINDGWKK